MARKAEFSIDSKSIFVELKKVDRKKIYGWSSVEVYDENNSPCKLAGIADGKYVMPSGSTSLVSLNSNGESVSRGDLVGVDSDGNKVAKVPSVYEEKVMLREATIDEYLSVAVKSVYQLKIEEDKEILLDELNAGKIYYFVFNYRTDFEGDDAFLISNENEIFVVTGMCADIEFIGLTDNEQELVQEDSLSADDDMDFAMF